MPAGPRIYFKRDNESSIGRGALLYGCHFTPEMARIIHAACRCSAGQAETLWITEGFRNIRETRDLHEEGRAFDLVPKIGGERVSDGALDRIAAGMRLMLDVDYDVIVHDVGSGAHIHAEYDPR